MKFFKWLIKGDLSEELREKEIHKRQISRGVFCFGFSLTAESLAGKKIQSPDRRNKKYKFS